MIEPKRRRLLQRMAAITLVVAVAMVLRITAAASLTVDTTADTVDGNTTSIANLLANKGADGRISLREAITAANSDAAFGPHTVNVPSGTYNLSSSLAVNTAMTVQGAGAALTQLVGNNTSRLVTLNTSGAVTLSSLSLRSGTEASADGGCASATGGSLTLSNVTVSQCTAPNGGALTTNGTALTLTAVTMSQNTSTSGGEGGGALFMVNGSLSVSNSTFSGNSSNTSGGGALRLAGTATTTITNTTFSGNSAAGSGGGAIRLVDSATASITDTTFTSNTSTGTGGGAVHHSANNSSLTITRATFNSNSASGNRGGGFYSTNGTTTVTNATFTANSASNGGAVAVNGGSVTLVNVTVAGNSATTAGQGLQRSAGTLSLRNTIVANNTGGGLQCDGTITNTANNLESGTSCLFGTANGSRNSTNPLLLPLADNGGSTLTMALSPGSPAINAGTSTSAPSADQRGQARVGSTDIGAFEFNTYAIGGTVFEDVNYGGGAARSLAASAGVPRSGATVELYTVSGSTATFSASTTTNGSGLYAFSNLTSGSYAVRVVDASVSSSRTGYIGGLLPVQTARYGWTSNAAVLVTDRVGGINPAASAAGVASSGAAFNTSTGAYSAGPSGTAQAFTLLTLGTVSAAGLDFGFNFSTIVNTNDTGQGSLRQFITNANALGGEATLAQAGRSAGVESSIFVLPTSDAGYQAGTQHWRSTPLSALPTLSSTLTVIDGLTQAGAAAGDLWAGTPHTLKVELFGNAQNFAALTVSGTGSGARGLVVGSFNNDGVVLTGTNNFVRTSYVGLDVTGTAASNVTPSAISMTAADPEVGGLGSGDGNVIAGTGNLGILSNAGTTGLAIRGNFIGSNATGTATVGTRNWGYGNHNGTSTVREIRRNLFVGGWRGFVLEADDRLTPRAGQTTWAFAGNHVGVGRDGSTALPNTIGVGNSVASSAFIVTGLVIGGTTAADRNVIAGNTGAGVLIGPSSSVVVIQGNYIGVAADGVTPRGNGGDGVYLATNSPVTIGSTTAGAGNVIAHNSGRGVNVASGTGAITARGNSIHSNGNIGIDLGNNGVTANDGAKTTGQPNQLMDSPVITSAQLVGSNLTVAGHVGSAAGQAAFANATVDVYGSDADGTGFGEGRSYIGTLTANGSGNFSGSITVPAGVTLTYGSSRLTGTATDAGGNTSEFGANFLLQVTIAGTVFEDVNYGGGAGRSLAASAGVPRSGATVELYTVSGSTATFSASTTTNGSGAYTFSSLAPGSYAVRVVDASVSSSRSGYTPGLLPVQTARHDWTANAPVLVTDHVGGINPAATSAGTATTGAVFNTSTGVFSAGPSGTAQAYTLLTLSSIDAAGLDFGFNFSTVVNTNDSGAGSLRQAITNANTLTGETGLAQQYRTAGVEHLVFMISNGTPGAGGSLGLAAGGLRSSINYFTTPAVAGNAATLTLASVLPPVTAPLVLDAQTQPGWTQAPRLEINGNGHGESVLISGGNSTLRGFVLNRARVLGQGNLVLTTLGGNMVQGNYIGTSVDGTASVAASGQGMWILSGDANLIGGSTATTRNVMANVVFNAFLISAGNGNVLRGNHIGTDPTGLVGVIVQHRGVLDFGGTNTVIGGSNPGEGNVISNASVSVGEGAVVLHGAGAQVLGNLIGVNATGTAALQNGGVGLFIGGSNAVVGGAAAGAGNVISGNAGDGIRITGTGAVVQGNRIGSNAAGTADMGNGGHGVRVEGSGNTIGGTATGAGNLIRSHSASGSGIAVSAGASGVAIRGNSIWANGRLGIDLLAAGDPTNGVTANDGSTTAGQPNLLMDSPVITSAQLVGSSLTVAGHVGSAAGQTAFANATVDVYESDADSTGFGEGRTYIGTLTANASGNFSGNITVPAGVTLVFGTTRLTATATDAAGNTSEFGANFLLTGSIAGTVFEDVNYGGGAGRSLAASAGVPRSGATVELYTVSGSTATFSSSTTTNGSGQYLFNNLATGSYAVRVVDASVTSSRAGYIVGLMPVQTARHDWTADAAVLVTDHVGGTNPAAAAAVAATTGAIFDTSTGAYSAGSSGTAQAFTLVTLASSIAAGLDFGFNFSTVVNTNNSGQGSLRQFITNANALGKTGLAQAGLRKDLAGANAALPAGTDTSIFMVPSGSAVPGIRAGVASQLTAGVAVITPGTQLPTLSAANIAVDGTTQTVNVGDTNSLLLGTGGTVGVQALALAQVPGPEVQITGNAGIDTGLRISGANAQVRGLSVWGFGASGAVLFASAGNATAELNVVGATATSTNDPRTLGTSQYGNSLYLSSVNTASVRNNFVAYGVRGLALIGGSNHTVSGNEMVGPCSNNLLEVWGTNNSNIAGNLIRGQAQGVSVGNGANGALLGNNTIRANGDGVHVGHGGSVVISLTLINNVITANGRGVWAWAGQQHRATITRNSIFSNSGIGIDLGNNGVTANDGAKTTGQPNLLMDSPVITSAQLVGGDLIVAGHVGSAAGQTAFADATVEVFASDADASGFGEGRSYIGTLTADASGNFSGSLTVPPGVTLAYGSSRLTSTATDAAGNTSEFGANFLLPVSIAGTVFEDVNYGGGAGRSLAASAGVPRSGATVELYTVSGSTATFSRSTTTNGSGVYTFSNLTSGSYAVRVVNASVTSSRSGYTTSLRPVQTARHDWTADAAVLVTDRVGGLNPAAADAGAASGSGVFNTSTGVFSAGPSGTAQSFTLVTLGSVDAAGLDFGFNFSTIVNTNNSGQGSLRQFLTNANTLGKTGLAQAGFRKDLAGANAALPAGTDTSIFMVPSGSAVPGIRAGVASQLTAGVAVITPGSGLNISAANVAVDGTTQTVNIGDTNSLLLGTGGTVGVQALALARVPGPEVQITGNAGISNGLFINGANAQVRGLSVWGFGSTGSAVSMAASNPTAELNVLGATATSTIDPRTSGISQYGHSLYIFYGNAASVRNNFLAYGSRGLFVQGGSDHVVSGNEVVGPSANNLLEVSLTNNSTITGNLIRGAAQGVSVSSGTNGALLENNTITANTVGGVTVAHGGSTVLGVTIRNNVITANGRGVSVESGYPHRATITRNSIFSNSGIGIDLFDVTANNGTKSTGLGNQGMDSPVLTRAVLGSNTLSVLGYVGSAALQSTFGGALVELYVSNAGQGQTYIGTVTANADGEFAGVVSTVGVSGLLAGSTQIVATATDAGGNTSEFGNSVTSVALAAFQNGGFETGTAPGFFTTLYTGNSTSIPGWSVTGGSVDYVGTGWVAAEGSRSLDLIGVTRGGVAQVVQTVPGSTYTLTWSMAGNTPCGSPVKNMRVTAASQQSTYSFDTTGRSVVSGWVDRSQVFTASAEATVVWFEALDAGSCGATLDNVRLSTGPPAAASISGTVFEDPNYGGGAGRARASATGHSPRPNARVELYDAAGNFLTSTTTDASGNYSFTNRALGNYTVRVVSDSVGSSRTGWVNTLVPTITYRANASGSNPIADTSFVGGADPLLNDAGNGITTLAALATATATAQAITPVQLAGDVAGLDFGFSFNVATNTQDAGSGSLRQALTNANALGAEGSLAQAGRTAGLEHIVFMLPNGTAAAGLRSSFNAFVAGVASIRPSTALPTLSAGLVMDAQTQPGWTTRPIIELSGQNQSGSTAMLVLASQNQLRGLVINRAPSAGLDMQGSNSVIEGNWIGLATDGASAAANGGDGVALSGNGHRVGGASAIQRNVISGNARFGIDDRVNGAANNIIVGNYIGLNAAGTAALPNGNTGIYLDNSTGNRVGGGAAGEGNVISGNGGAGILAGAALVAQGNYVGTDFTGLVAIPNASHGVQVIGASNTLTQNIISGNGSAGVRLEAAANGTVLQGNRIGVSADGSALKNASHSLGVLCSTGCTVGLPGSGNTIAGGTAGHAVLLQGTGSTVQANFIGTDPTGTQARGTTGFDGIHVSGSGHFIGAVGAGNVISGNGRHGVLIIDGSHTVQANRIGVDAAGTAALGNAEAGLAVTTTAGAQTIGGSAAGAGNVISGNLDRGILISSSSASGTTVQGNFVGLNVNGTAAIANGGAAGIQLGGTATGVTLGGTVSGAGNVISGNAARGVHIQSGSHIVQGNIIGLNASGTAAVRNNEVGLVLDPGTGATTIGGTQAGAGNTISGNLFSGIWFNSASAAGTTIQGNRIGTGLDGSTLLGNSLDGVSFRLGSSNDITVGGTAAGAGNTIAGNTGAGVRIDTATTGHAIRGNSIHSNGGLGIDLSFGAGTWAPGQGLTPNDGLKPAGRPNLEMDQPVLTTAALAGNQLFVSGHVGSAPGQTLFGGSQVEVFVSDEDGSGHGEGRTYLGLLTAGANGGFSGRLTIPGTITITPGTTRLTATATDTAGNTSEFGANLTVTAGIGGRVFEDANYGGGAGRGWAVASANGAQPRSGAVVELGLVSGSVVTIQASTTTAADGSYLLPTTGAGSYLVRVVSETVSSSRSGWNAGLRPVLTYMAHAPAGTLVERTDFVGGLNPAATDAGAAPMGATVDASTGVFTSGASGTANASGTVQVGASAGIGDIDFGFSFNTVVNTNDTGPGSLRQAITNANTLGDDGTLAVAGRSAGREHVVFMIPNGTTGAGGSLNLAAGGLRSAFNLFTTASGTVATVRPASWLNITQPLVLDAQTQPGWTERPIIELDGSSVGSGNASGLTVNASATATVLRGLVINRFVGGAVNGITAYASDMVIQGNWLGLGATGGDQGNRSGVWIASGAHRALIGGNTAAQRNVISGNDLYGVYLGTNGFGTLTDVVVSGNYIGTDPTGTTAVGNTAAGVVIVASASGTTLGGAGSGQGNLISGNGAEGVYVSGASTTIRGNFIGTNAAGTAALPNGEVGVAIDSGSNTVGGSGSGEGNLISGNASHGISINGSNNILQGNLIGTNLAGTAALPNGTLAGLHAGISLTAGSGNLIGGSNPGEGNLLSGNGRYGARLRGAAATNNRLLGNRIGVNAAGTAALANGHIGVVVDAGASSNRVGGPLPGEGNHIAGNPNQGVWLGTGTGTIVQGNRIGSNSAGTAALAATGRPNNGIMVVGSASGHVIGGVGAGEANTITGSTGAGVVVSAASGPITIRANAIWGNDGIGIDLLGDGVTANNGNTTAGQPNLLIDHPVFTAARARGNQLTVTGYVGSAAGQSTFANARVEVFESDNDGTGFGEGRSYLGFVTTDASGNFSGTLTMPVSVLRIGTRLTGTATDAAGNTSEFGANFANLVVDNVVNHNGDAPDANPGDGLCETATPGQCTLRAAIEEFNAWPAQSNTPTVAFELPGCSAAGQAACRIAPVSALPTISRAMAVDAQTQPNWASAPIVQLDGAGAPSFANGLSVTAAGSVVRGFVIGGFGQAGIRIEASSVTIEGNWIGLATDGNTARANGAPSASNGGVHVVSGTGIVIGGNSAAQRNVLSGNGGAGLWANAGTLTAIGNYIGTNAAGTAALGNGRWGVHLVSGTGHRLGGALPGEGNVVSGNVAAGSGGIHLGGGTSQVIIQGNRIGTNAAGTGFLPNGALTSWSSGIDIRGGSGHLVGGTDAAQGNTIAGNNGAGVRVEGQTSRVLGNSIYGNAWLGIDLATNPSVANDGLTANDGAVNGTAPNNGMDHPVITGAGVNPSATALTVSGYVGTGSGQAVFAGARVEFFKAAPDPSGYGEGQTYLGFLTADANGRFSGTITFAPSLVAVGDAITATATDAAGNTSEFGPNWTSTTVAALPPAGFNAFDSGTAAGALAGAISSKVAGSAASLAVIALDNSGTALHAGFTGSVTLTWLDARNDSAAASGSCRASWVDLGSAGTAVFSNTNRVNVALTPPAASTRSMRLQMTYTGPGGTVVACSNDNFAALPAQLAWGVGGGGAGSHGATDSNSASPGTTRALDNTAANGGVVHQAGRPFTLRARALDAGGNLMNNYDGSPVLAISGCLLPSGCSPGALSATTAAAAGGVYENSTVSYSEVGAIALQLSDTDYASVDNADTAPAARTVGSNALSVGRFVPDSYSAVLSSTGQFATANVSCLAPGSAATFIGQPFAWSAAPQVTVTARNAAGTTTQLWSGALMKLDASSGMNATLSASATGAATLNTTAGPLAVQDLGSGQARISASALDRFVLEAAAPQASVTPSWQWQLAFVDSSEAGTPGNPQPGASASQAAVLFNQGGGFHSARLTLNAAHGDARMGVQMALQLQRFTPAGWVTMTEDRGCVSVQRSQLWVQSPSGVFASTSACAAPLAAPATTAGGRAWLRMPATPGGAPGRLALRLPGDGASGNACSSTGSVQAGTGLGLPWLLGGSGGAGALALATWGAPNRDVVLRREVW